MGRPLAPRQGSALSEAWFPYLRASTSHISGAALRAGHEVVTKLNSGDGRRTQMLSLTLSGFGIERSFAALYYECFNGLFAIGYGIAREHVHTLVSSCTFSSMPARRSAHFRMASSTGQRDW